MTATYMAGNLVRLSAVFESPGCSPTFVDPDVVIVRTKAPDGTVTSYQYTVDQQVVQESAGHYYIDVEIIDAGTWSYRWEGTGGYEAANEGTFKVTANSFAGSP
jgi:hypothetical protein